MQQWKYMNTNMRCWNCTHYFQKALIIILGTCNSRQWSAVHIVHLVKNIQAPFYGTHFSHVAELYENRQYLPVNGNFHEEFMLVWEWSLTGALAISYHCKHNTSLHYHGMDIQRHRLPRCVHSLSPQWKVWCFINIITSVCLIKIGLSPVFFFPLNMKGQRERYSIFLGRLPRMICPFN